MSEQEPKSGELLRPQRPNPFEGERELTPELLTAQQATLEAWRSAPGVRRHCITLLIEPFIGGFVSSKGQVRE